MKREKKSKKNSGGEESFQDPQTGKFLPGRHWRPKTRIRERKYLFQQYVEKGRSTGEIAKENGVTDAAILYWLRKHGIERRSVSQARGLKYWGSNGEKNPMYGKYGPDNPNYKNGRTPERQRAYSRVFWKKLVEAVHERDGHRCVRCGTEDGLGTHHLKSWKAHPEARFDVSQIVTVCRPCHRWIHSKRNKNYEFLSSRRYTG